MAEDLRAGYLAGLADEQRNELAQVNEAGLNTLEGYLASRDIVAFLGAGASAPLYPLWAGLIGELVDAAAGRLRAPEAASCRALAAERPDEVVEIVQLKLGTAEYREVLREVLRVRSDPASGRSWTPVQELVCRCAFKAVVTTNYDPGIVDARLRVRPGASATGFMTWEDELGLDRWRTGDVFGDAELPVLFAHGQHNRPDSVVLATTEYRRAYAGKLPQVLGRLVDGGHLAWIGFSFADQRIAAILREIAEMSGTRADPGAAARHVAVMPWDPAAAGHDPWTLAHSAQIGYGAQVVLYPAPGGDHSALQALLSWLADPQYPSVGDLPARPSLVTSGSNQAACADGTAVPVMWVPGMEPVEHFTGRKEELARMDRWAADDQVALVGASAWGGAGKTALVTRWVQEGAAAQRPGVRGVFGWSFYADPSAEHWADLLLDWAQREFGVPMVRRKRTAEGALAVLQTVPLLLVLDGLEVLQEGPAGDGFGRLLDGTLREVLSGACLQRHGSLVILTSRFPFADLEAFDGDRARMLEVPPFTPAEGSALLAAAGGYWLEDDRRRSLVGAVDGHPLATAVLAGLLAARTPVNDLTTLHAELAAAARTSERVSRVVRFYAERLSEADRYLLAAISLFARPVPAEAVLAVAQHEEFAKHHDGWTAATVEASVRDRLSGLASWHPDGTISAHPLVRGAFRPLVLGAAQVAAETSLTGLPDGKVDSREDALRVVEAIELLLDAGQWRPAHDLHRNRAGEPPVWQTMPAASLGQRAAAAFVGTASRRDSCAVRLAPRHLGLYLNAAGLFSTYAGDLATAKQYLHMAVHHYRDMNNTVGLPLTLLNLAASLGQQGDIGGARTAATEALAFAQGNGDQEHIWWSHAYLGWLAGLSGDTIDAGQHFTIADQIHVINDPDGDHLFSVYGIRWAEWLVRTSRLDSARMLTLRNAELCSRYGWHNDKARCDHLFGLLDLTTGKIEAAGEHLTAAAACFRDGDHLTELAVTLADLAKYALDAADIGAASQHVAETITIAAPRGMIPAQSAALAVRAGIHACRYAAGDPSHLLPGRDDADAALRLAARHHLAWQELDALSVHATLDKAEGIDHGWAATEQAVKSRLIPPDMDPDPLTTVEQFAARRAAEQGG
jgi:tetratricopeptide (TPR) repeat protein